MSVRTALSFDVGGRRIGVAVGNTLSGTARELAVILVRDQVPDWALFDRLVREWRPDVLVVGDPIEAADALAEGVIKDIELMQPARQFAHRFAQMAAKRCGIQPILVDERHSSKEAAARFAMARREGGRRRKDAAQLDAGAAVIILERWLSQGAFSDNEPSLRE